MPDTEKLSALLLKLYAAPAELTLWRPVFKEITEMVGLTGMAVLFQDSDDRYNAFLYDGPQQQQVWELYAAHFGPLDTYRPPMLNQPESELVWGDELCPPRDIRKTEFYNDLLLPFDIRMVCGTWTLKRKMSNEVVLFHSSWNSPDPSPDQMSTLSLLLPHLRLALRTRQQLARLADTEATLAGALNKSAYGILLLAADGSSLHANKCATELFARRDGVQFERKRLRAAKPSEDSRLQKLIKDACSVNVGSGTNRGGAISISRVKGSSLQVLVSPFFSEQVSDAVSGNTRVAAIVLISDPDRQPLGRTQALQMLYRLTPAEARLVDQLGSGLSMAEASEKNGVTRETVKSQLKSVLNKTGTRRQIDLLRLVSTIPPVDVR